MHWPHESIEDMRSRQNDINQHNPAPAYDPNQPGSNAPLPHQTSVNTPLTTPTMQRHTPMQQPPHPNNTVPTPMTPAHNIPPPTNFPPAFVQNPPVQTTNVTQTSHKYWKIAPDDNFEPHRFQTFIKDLTLMDDSLHSIRLFYNKVRHAMHTSFKRHTDILPNFDSLTPTTNFRNLLVPTNDQYIGYTSIQSIYYWFSDSISNLLMDTNVINHKRTPQAHQIIITNGNISDGWTLLFHLLTKRCPFLGGKPMDVASEITFLKTHHNDTIHTFFKRVQDIETKLMYSRENIDKTRLLSFYLKATSASTVHFNLLQHFTSDLNLHISTYGSNVPHPTMTCSTVYDYLTTIDAPEEFSVPNKNKHKNYKNTTYKHTNKQGYSSGYSSSTISALELLPDIMENNDILDSLDKMNITDDDEGDDATNDTNRYNTLEDIKPFISAFRQSSNIICDACGGRGHHAQKCFKRGNNFLPRDVQRRIAAYNAKHGDSPTTDASPTPDKSYHALPPPDHRPPPQYNTTKTSDQQTASTPTFSQLGNNILTPTIEELLDEALGTPHEPTIHMMNANHIDTPIITHKSSLLQTMINPNGTVMSKYLHYFQHTYLDHYSPDKYTEHRQALYHVDSGANVHATNIKSDFIVFHSTKNTINLAAGTKAVSEGIGAILIRLNKTYSPIVLAPVYYCPTAKVSTLSPGAILTYNGYHDVNLRILKALEYQETPTSKRHSLPTTVYNNMDYLALPVIHIKHKQQHLDPKPNISTIAHNHTNNQFIHQQFDHRNMQMIIEMKKHNLMEGLPTDISHFHSNYTCPICRITNATKVPTNKTSDRTKLKPVEWFCFDYSFWNRKSIRGFTSLLTAICISTRYSFVFPSRNKRPPP